MRKLCLGFSFAAMILLVACGSESGTEVSSELPPGFSKPSSERSSSDGGSDNSGESSTSGNKVSSASEGGESAGSDASIYDANANTLTDLRDGQVYRTTTISIPTRDYSEVWTAENMNYTTDNSYCHGDEPDNCDIYGRLYTWEAALNACPQGWHLPSSSEWEKLILAAGGKKLKSTSGWSDYEGKSGNGTDIYSFAALPAGTRSTDGKYYYEGYNAIFWSSTESKDGYVYVISLDSYGGVDQGGASQGDGLSVRCLKD